MYLSKTPGFLQKLFPHFTWKIPNAKGKIYLSFDDGPIPEVTPWVLDELSSHNAKASFFCVGENVDKNPELYKRILEEGHTIGSHTQNHLMGWHTDNLNYLLNVRKCAQKVNSTLFRPPYGRMTRSQANFLQRHYKIVMWDVLSGDFDDKISSEKCLQNVLGSAMDGSIVVFHDSLKAEEKLRFVLPKVLDYYSERGYSFENLASALFKSDKKVQIKTA